MKYPVILAAVAASIVVASTACGSSRHPDATTTRTAPRTSAAAPAGAGPTVGEATVSGLGGSSPFCTLARRVGQANLGVSSGNLNPDPARLLSQIDQLDALAPADLKPDFDVYAAFEHAVLQPGTTPAPPAPGDTTAALKHVSSYFAGTCGVH